jgi:hypothetical protein
MRTVGARIQHKHLYIYKYTRLSGLLFIIFVVEGSEVPVGLTELHICE